MADAPPGYRGDHDEPPSFDPGAPTFYYSVLLGATSVALGHELLVRQLAAYQRDARVLLLVPCLATALVAAWFAARRSAPGGATLSILLSALSIVTTGSAFALFFSFPRGAWLVVALVAVSIVASGLLGAVGVYASRVFGASALKLGLITYALNPFRLALLGVAFGIAAMAAAMIGLLRSAAAIGMVLALLSGWTVLLAGYLDRRPLPRARPLGALAVCVFALAAGAMAFSERLVPLADIAFFAGDVVYARKTEHEKYVFVSSQGAFDLFVGKTLKVSTLDGSRYPEALVEPALAAAERHDRALVLGSGEGLIEHELLSAGVGELTLVTRDRALADLSSQIAWLRERSRARLASERVRIVEREPIVWLEEEAQGVFDVAIVDLLDPQNHIEGKNYTRYFYARLAERLAPDGVAAIQATSAFATPQSFGGIVQTLQAAGLHTLPYRAAVPSVGEWGFVLASRRPLPVPAKLATAADSLTPELLASLFVLPRDAAPRSDVRPSFLHEQNSVVAFHEEREAARP